ncbi:very short patch repair endonuclease [Burkholderia aenigmatica]|uniref:Very short patch repair endonuclease n=1 Tax=Burkholderia aenigmatica TaxID=2015348 RepID=A0A228IX02_9BURK|nr:very short patch repair endonuclease [Burkholderia aenigmatica]OXI46699.1 very short patch repair endonuclease [Burkholderia aenigmatica]
MAISRSENMRRIRSKDTKPELTVRRLIRSLGYTGYRLHWKSVPGKPDIAFVGRKRAIIVQGCFWHQHSCLNGRIPRSNENYWRSKLTRNLERDAEVHAALRELGWSILILWECELKDHATIKERISRFLAD